MNFHQYLSVDVTNGEGTRCTLFVSGCEHQCKGCYNQSTWSPNSGHPYNQELEDRIITELNDQRIKRRGLSLTGGDPLLPANLASILSLVQRVKTECINKDIWLWTGYTLNELTPQQAKVLEYVDVLIDGKFERELASPNLKWRGSSNQVIYHLGKNT